MTKNVIAAISLAVLLGGCAAANSLMGGNSAKEAEAAMVWSFAPNAIQIEVASDRRLNLYDGQPHTLVLAVCQTAEANAFLALLRDPATVGKLFGTGKGGPEILGFDRLIIEPGKRKLIMVNRMQSAKFVGIIAGYYRWDAQRNTRIYQIPVQFSSEGLVVKTRTATPAVLGIRLVLGADGIERAEAVNQGAEPQAAAASAPASQLKSNEISVQDIGNAVNAVQAVRKLQ